MTQNERRSLPIWKRIVIVIITLVVFALQISLFALLFQINFNNQLNIVLYIVIELVGFGVVMHIIHKPILTSYKLTWSILIMLMPLPFTLFYMLNAQSRRLPRHKQRKINAELNKYSTEENCIHELELLDSKAARYPKVLNYPVYKNTIYTFLNDGRKKFDDLVMEIKKAKNFIFIETFILSDGYVLETILPILEQKGTEGVEIKIIYDDLGSKATLKNKSIKRITRIPHCQITNYNPLGLNINPAFNYRDHRKITIIDGKIAYCGGDNYADEYIHQKPRFGFWRDNCGKYEGEAVASFTAMFVEMWYMSTKEILPLEKYYVKSEHFRNSSFIVPFGDGPSNGVKTGYDVFCSLITSADKTLYISTPYLVIDTGLLDNIVLAAKSGIDVRILMPGIPDKKAAFYLARSHYRDILKAGGKIYEYSKGFNHAKNIIVDNKYAFIGTINMDYRSLFLHYECGAIILLDDEIHKMQEDFLSACDESHQVTYEEWKKRPWWQRVVSYVLYLFAPLF
ncbi:MAG: cardiolipin synthase [Anaeroplasmataceae bacterium]|nr:cardiolipin synthase [Anaeroplasmataceae bacterium]